LIKKRIAVQKGFRINSNIAEYLDILSKACGRSQNELVSIALLDLLKDNLVYFIESYLFDCLDQSGNSMFCELGGISFAFEANFLMIFSTNHNQNKYSISIGDFPKSLFGQELDLSNDDLDTINHSISSANHNGTSLIDVIEITFLNDDIKEQIHDSLIQLNLNFIDMQKWINSEFDIS